MKEIIFEVREDEVDGGFNASALGHGIHTEGDTLAQLRANVKEAVEAFFDESMDAPRVIRLHFVRDEVIARWNCPATYPATILAKALRVLGYVVTRQKGSHMRMTTQQGGEHHEVIPAHDPIKTGTLSSILKSIAAYHEINVEELLRRLGL